jgi:uncharacterized damage-inducible protein DinB
MMIKQKPSFTDLIRSLSASPDKIMQLVEGLDNEIIHRHPALDEWNVAETVFHLRDIEPQYRARLKRIVVEDTPKVPAIWPSPIPDPLPSLIESMDSFRIERAITIDFLSALPPEAWERQAHHATLGTVNIHDQVKSLLEHDEDHFYQIVDILDTQKK